jgi:hypothetical protein
MAVADVGTRLEPVNTDHIFAGFCITWFEG